MEQLRRYLFLTSALVLGQWPVRVFTRPDSFAKVHDLSAIGQRLCETFYAATTIVDGPWAVGCQRTGIGGDEPADGRPPGPSIHGFDGLGQTATAGHVSNQ